MLTSHELLGFMTPGLANDILSFLYEEDKPLYKATMAGVAEARKLRTVFLERQPRPQRHATMLATLSRPSLEMVTANVLRSWLLKKHNALLVDFLTGLGIEQKDGVVEKLPDQVEDDKLKSSVDAILAKHPREVVAVYLNAFAEMNDVEWESLKAMLREDARLQLAG
jgi:hypothetical protein